MRSAAPCTRDRPSTCLDDDALLAAKPDLVVTQELCEVCAVSYREVEQAARLMDADTKVVSLEPHSIDDILSHVELVGRLAGADDRGARRRAPTHARARRRFVTRRAGRARPRVASIEWLDPIFAAGHWVPEQVAVAGGDEVLGPRGVPSPEVPWQAVLDAQPEVVIAHAVRNADRAHPRRARCDHVARWVARSARGA